MCECVALVGCIWCALFPVLELEWESGCVLTLHLSTRPGPTKDVLMPVTSFSLWLKGPSPKQQITVKSLVFKS